ncbi:hypothetical protein K437DRAFT_267850 [Tilletiaria anomala UBC 951]|uniref:SET domain-containing protein n=1 Tax=Tilletiaria anomala (strain ATCC 24038 / CBS 436.72 / UBC 951) TaxID=1037660 RepID=A0A066W0R1_TILAU|nr:uncharacterized protein K437DRAFT_267850 [Tilletiaria anomala UBC 951]KDN47562.1 hypothetical protein K437DRAFT_267850 [Tilletiaria anomala UBC 951]
MGTVPHTNMEDLSADDDLLSDILLDHLEWEQPISTHKMNPQYRSPRFDTSEASGIVRRFCVEMQDVVAGVEAICQMSVVKKLLQRKSSRQQAAFQAHARRYLECYLPDSGVEFALTMRYKQSPGAPLRSRKHRAMLRAAQEGLEMRASGSGVVKEEGEHRGQGFSAANGRKTEGSGDKPGTSASASMIANVDFGATSLSNLPPLAPPGVSMTDSALLSKADLCILAVRPFKPGDLITACKGGITDLSKEEDEALREEAAHFRALKHGHGQGHPDPGGNDADNEGGPAGPGPVSDEAGAARRSEGHAHGAEVTVTKGNGKAKVEPGTDADAGADEGHMSGLADALSDTNGDAGHMAATEDASAAARLPALPSAGAGIGTRIGRRARGFKYKGVLGAGRDFSVVRSARKGCSQLFLGPARFINHDCEPNVEFYRMGSQMTFRCIRPIAVNEEIVTYYGDNYFELGNAECLCATCEARGTGAFSSVVKTEDVASGSEDVKTAAELDGISSTNGENGSGVGGEDGGGAMGLGLADISQQHLANSNGSAGIQRSMSNGMLDDSADRDEKKGIGRRGASRRPAAIAASAIGFNEFGRNYYASHMSASEGDWAEMMYKRSNSSTKDGNLTRKLLDEPEALLESAGGGNKGPERECVTCGARFWSKETWWRQEECQRCERHYKIFKADWPGRVPTESLIARSKGKKPGEAVLTPGKEEIPTEHASNGRARERERAPSLPKKRASYTVRERRTASFVSMRKRDVSSESSQSSISSASASFGGTPVVLTPLRDGIGQGTDDNATLTRKAPRKSKTALAAHAAAAAPPIAPELSAAGAGATAAPTPAKAEAETAPTVSPLKKRGRPRKLDKAKAEHFPTTAAADGLDENAIDEILGDRARKVGAAADEHDSSDLSSVSSLSQVECIETPVAAGASVAEAEQQPPPSGPASGRSGEASRGEQGQSEDGLLGGSQGQSPLAEDLESSSSAATGPKMLGKDAKTETLAMYWGAVNGDRRSRRKSISGGPNERASLGTAPAAGPAPSSRRIVSAGHHQHHLRRSAEDSRSSSRNLPSPQASPGPVRKKARITESEDGSDDPMPSRSDDGHDAKKDEDFSSISSEGSSSKGGPVPGLATKGPARTSVQNLALAWSAGTEGGRTRRRAANQPVKLATPPASSTSNKRRRLSREGSTESSRAGSANVDDDALTARARGRPRKVQSEATLSPAIAAADLTDVHTHAPRADSPAPTAHIRGSAPPEADEGRQRSVDFKLKDEIIGDEAGSAVADDSAEAPSPPPQGHSRTGSSSTFPLPLPLPFANRSAVMNVENIPLRQPARKNLRWGKGKTTASRPLPPLGPGIPQAPSQVGMEQLSPGQAASVSPVPDEPIIQGVQIASPGHVGIMVQPVMASSVSLQAAIGQVNGEAGTTATVATSFADSATGLPLLAPSALVKEE